MIKKSLNKKAGPIEPAFLRLIDNL